MPGSAERIEVAVAREMWAAGDLVVDVRLPEEYALSHIPGAINRPTTENVLPDGRFADPDTLRQAFELVGVRGDAQVGAYCGSGVTAAHEVLALERAGVRAALYPGSWSEWIRDPERAIASGED